MIFLDTDWGKGTACAFGMALVLSFPQALNFVVGALLLQQTIHHFRAAFRATERESIDVRHTEPANPVISGPTFPALSEPACPVIEAREQAPLGDGLPAIRL